MAARQTALEGKLRCLTVQFFIAHPRYNVIRIVSGNYIFFLKSQLNYTMYSCGNYDCKNYMKSILWSFLIGKSYLAWRMSHIIQLDTQKRSFAEKFLKIFSMHGQKIYLKKKHSHIQAQFKIVLHM